MVDHKTCAHAGLMLLLATVWLSTPAWGQTAGLSDVLAPCFDEQTFGVIWVDATRIDVDALFDTVVDIARQTEGGLNEDAKTTLEEGRQQIQEVLTRFTSAGGRTAYVVWNAADLPQPLVAIPVAAGADASELGDWLRDNIDAPDRLLHRGNLVVAGEEHILARWEGKPPMRRPDLDRAAAAAKPAAVQVLLAPDADSRRVLEALLATQPQARAYVTEGVLTKGLQWAVLTIQAPPQLSLDLHIESADAASATALADTIGRILQSVGKMPILDEVSPNLSETLGELVLGVSGNTLRLTLDTTQSTRLIADVVVPPLSRTRALARQMTCATHLRQIGMSMLMYANDNDDKFPPNLEILVDEAELPPVVLTCSEGPAYVYRGVNLPGVAAPPGLITVHDPPGAHPGGRNVLYVDTHVDFVHEDRFAEAIAKDNEQRRSLGLPEKPAQ